MISEKHIIVTGHSSISWKDAIVKTISEASKTLNHLNSVEILSQRAILSNNKISEYLVDLDITFKIDPKFHDINFQDVDSDLN